MLRRTLPSSDPSIRRSAPPPTPSQEQMAEWEAKLAGEGMGVEAGEGVDKGAEALKREKLEEKYGKAVKDIQNEMLYYWLSRSPLSTWGDHKQAADRLAKQFSIDSTDAVVLMEDLQDEATRAELAARELYRKIISGRVAMFIARPEAAKRQLISKLAEQFSGYSYKVLDALAQGVVGE
ncbi:MAG: hypothetical protein UU08_C0006G0039 [Candidatus Uhrbacteria bacterium GW2011_GWE2_40_58]|nr:MAG: hypothetical protein UT94_C0007G0009 [Candidatus Uhrbacteria bacterium GW2011_GWF2_40_263]KKR67920.1 MAG: hypothetical protein UU08_C0006G0039 [Candidatus Uhrbacteria bacterium GW2011_GWE2_40_58]